MCADRDELREWLSFGDWSNGSAFAIESTPEADGRVITLCFVQQGERTDEWLIIKSWPRVGGTWTHLAFESISWHYICWPQRLSNAEPTVTEHCARKGEDNDNDISRT